MVDLVEAVVRPFVAILDEDPVAGLAWMKLFTALGLAEDPIWVRGVGRSPSIADLYAQVLQRALPEVRGDELYRRVGIAMYGMLSALASVDLAGYGHPISRRAWIRGSSTSWWSSPAPAWPRRTTRTVSPARRSAR